MRGLWVFVALVAGGVAGAQDARGLFEQAERAQVEDSIERAIELYKASLARNPGYHRPMVGLAESYFALDEYEEALRWVREARRYARDDTSIMTLEGRILIGLGDLGGAAAIFGQVLSREPNNLEAKFGQAELEVASGRTRQAAARYLQALSLSPNNRKALVSLALLHEELGETEAAASYVDLALRHHSGDPQVHYTAARLLASADPKRAAEHLELALAMRSTYREASVLAALLALNSGDDARASSLASRLVAQDRSDETAWYLLGVSHDAAGRVQEAANAYTSALRLAPDHEAARIALEGLALDSFPLGSAQRLELSGYHAARGESLRQKHLLDKAYLEYRRALVLDPEAVEARVAFASIYRANGLPKKELKELQILASLGKAGPDVQNTIEVRERELGGGVAADWKVDQYAIEHRKRTVLVVGATNAMRLAWEDSGLVRYLREAMQRYDTVEVVESPASLASFDQAFRSARGEGIDYFLLTQFGGSERSVQVSWTLYLGRTGSALASGRAYRTGNDRLRDATAAVAETVVRRMPMDGVLLKRDFALGLVDLGAAQGIEQGQELAIVKKGTARLRPPEGTLSAAEEDRLGTFTVGRVDENVSEGTISIAGFHDRVNVGDEVILQPAPPPPPPAPAPEPRNLLQRLFGVRAAR